MTEVMKLLIINNFVICGAVVCGVVAIDKLTKAQIDSMTDEIVELKRELRNIKRGVISDD